MNWTEEQVLALAPDASASKSGRELAAASKWVSRSLSDRALWGECQGSGRTPYRTQIDLKSTAFKCSCPSRKFPCKHGIGLFLLYVRQPEGFTNTQEPEWVAEWLDKREQRDQKKSEAKSAGTDLAAKAKRTESRLRKVKDGIEETQLWIKDLIRSGLVSIPEKSHSFWQAPAARMVDAQAPGLASMIRKLGDIDYFIDGWQSELLSQLLKIYLASEGFKNIESLPPLMQEDVRSLIGFSKSQEELKASEGVKDHWQVLGKQADREDALMVHRTWLYGKITKRFAMVIQFAFGSQQVETSLIPGTEAAAELVFYPGNYQMRAIIKQHVSSRPLTNTEGIKSWSEADELLSSILTTFPWADKIPVVINAVTPVKKNDAWVLQDTDNKYVELIEDNEKLAQILACSGGEPVSMFVIKENSSCVPLGIWHEQQYRTL